MRTITHNGCKKSQSNCQFIEFLKETCFCNSKNYNTTLHFLKDFICSSNQNLKKINVEDIQIKI